MTTWNDLTAAPDSVFDEARARWDAADNAPEAHDPAIWSALTELLPCHPFGDCGDECECTAGEVRLAAERLIMAERLHHAECDGDGCCDRVMRRVQHVGRWHT